MQSDGPPSDWSVLTLLVLIALVLLAWLVGPYLLSRVL
jgi:hypothetical protein